MQEAQEQPFFEGGKNFQESPEPNVDMAALAIERIAKISEEAGRQPKWEDVLSRFDEARENFKRENNLSVDEIEEIDVLFGAGKVMHRELERDREDFNRSQLERLDTIGKKSEKGKMAEAGIAREKEEAFWQQRMALFTLKNRNWEGLEKYLDKFWAPLETLSKKLLGPKSDRIEREQRGIARLVTAVRIFEKLGYGCWTSGGYHDAIDKIDFVAIKKMAGKEIAMLIQAKPNEWGDKPEPKFETFYPLPERGAEIPEKVWGLIEWVKKNQALREHKLVPILARIPNNETRPDEIDYPSGIPKKSFLDNLPKECLYQIRKVEEEQIENTQRHNKRRIYVPKQQYQSRA